MHLFGMVDVPGVIGFLIEVTIKGTLVLAAAGLAAAALKSASAAVRHLVWSTALVLLLALPVFVAFAPSYDVAVLPADVGLAPTSHLTVPQTVSGVSDRSVMRDRRSSRARADFDTGASTGASDRFAARETTLERSPSSVVRSAGLPTASPRLDWRRALFVLWIMGAAMVTARYALGWMALRKMRRRTVPVSDVCLRLLVKRTAAGIGLRRRIRVVWGAIGSMPLTFGCFQPTVLLPEEAREWPIERLIVVLKHELAHVKRRDCFVQAVVYFACTLYWFNPLVWVAAAQSHREREMACDDYVLSSGARGSEYAGHLLEIARSLRGPRLSGVTTIAMARRSELEGRLMAILSPDRKRGRATTQGALVTLAVLGCLVMTVAALRPVPVQSAQDVKAADAHAVLSVEAPVAVLPSTRAEWSYQAQVASADTGDSHEERYIAEASALIEKAAATLESSLVRLIPRTIRLNGSVVGNIDGAINLIAEGGLEIVRPDTIPLEQIRRLRNAGVDVAFIDAMASVGFDRLTVDQLVSLAHADVDADFVRRFREAGFADLSVDDFINIGFAGVDPDDVEVWAEIGYSDLSANELIKLAHADVDADYVKALAELGYRQVSPSELVQLGHADVDPDFILAMRGMGLDDLSTHDLIRLSHADVDPTFIRQMSEMGLNELSTEDLVRLSHADVDVRLIADLGRMGLSDLSVEELIKLGHADIDAEVVARFARAGLTDLSASDLAQLGFADVDAEFIVELSGVGLTDLAVSDLVMLSHAGVDVEGIRKLREMGFKTSDPHEIIKLHHMDVDPEYVERIRRSLERNKD